MARRLLEHVHAIELAVVVHAEQAENRRRGDVDLAGHAVMPPAATCPPARRSTGMR